MRTIEVSEKAPAEKKSIGFDFTNDGVTNIDSVVMSISIVSGVDPNVNSMLVASAVLTGPVVTHIVQNGVDGVVYFIRADIVSANQTHSLAMILPIKELIP